MKNRCAKQVSEEKSPTRVGSDARGDCNICISYGYVSHVLHYASHHVLIPILIILANFFDRLGCQKRKGERTSIIVHITNECTKFTRKNYNGEAS